MIYLFAILFVLVVGLSGFMVTNIDHTTSVTLFDTDYHNVALTRVVIISVIIGAGATGLLAVIEGAKARLENRRLKRSCRTLETELNYFRTQPSSRDYSAKTSSSTTTTLAKTHTDNATSPPASAPVYDTVAGEQPRDPEDGTYSGGRAV